MKNEDEEDRVWVGAFSAALANFSATNLELSFRAIMFNCEAWAERAVIDWRERVGKLDECSQCHQHRPVKTYNFGGGLTLPCCKDCVSVK